MHGVCKISVESSTTSLTNDIKMPKVTIMSSDSKQKPPSISKRRKDLFGDCALVEIIHLHDCLRGALQALEKDVSLLSSKIVANITSNKVHELRKKVASRFKVIWSVFQAHSSAEDEFIWPALAQKTNGQVTGSKPNNVVEQEEYEEDHADEERMFSHMDYLLTELKDGLLREHTQDQPDMEDKSSSVSTVKTLNEVTQQLSQHLMVHLEKEEQQCMPLVVKHLSKSEIHDLVGQIMGKRSSDMIAQILTMAVQNLNSDDRDEMVTYMKQAMAGTFFDRWLSMSGWMENDNNINKKKRSADSSQQQTETDNKRRNLEHTTETDTVSSNMSPLLSAATNRAAGVASQAELEKLIRAIAINPNLTSIQKNTTIQGLRDSVWKINQAANHESAVSATSGISSRRVTPPSIYYKKNGDGKNITVWNSDDANSRSADDETIPLFSASEMAPSYHDGATGSVLGCPHYARACKLRHPISGRLYTCRLCCDQEREMPSKDQDQPLDRYSVKEVMCMKCNALQPANDRCINTTCESSGKAFAKYHCQICNLYDDRSRPIFHCPYCNTCRMGLGLGIDFRHCMRCNACVSLSDKDHRCIPQKLQGTCPICHELLFQSTAPLKGLKCGHVMHLSCYTEYRRGGQAYTCPLCMKSMEDMSDYFALLDAAVRMQPMPAAYLSTYSNIYCQDCEKTGQCRYHFVGQKCPSCGSYNTRELGRVQASS